MTNVILVIVLLLISGSAIVYLINSKKRGHHCVGCPHAKHCSSKSCKINSK